MPAMYEIRWQPDGPMEQFAGSRGNYYEFAESDHLDLYSVPVWCHRCGRITDGENLSSVEEIEKQISELNDSSSQLYRMTRHGVLDKWFGKGDEFLQNRLTELLRCRRWRESRKEPPKCIHCGTTDILEFPIGVPVPSPRGDGEVQIDCVGMCSTRFNEWFFTPEGDRIPRDTRPTYWHHPDLD
jgi:hypothetical protein